MKGVIFDLDGTLVRLQINYDVIFKNLAGIFGSDVVFKPLIATIVNLSKNESTRKKAFEIICNEEQKAAEKFEIIKGAAEILDSFSEKYSLGLVTMQCKKAFEKIHSQFDKLSVFSSVITRDQSHTSHSFFCASVPKA